MSHFHLLFALPVTQIGALQRLLVEPFVYIWIAHLQLLASPPTYHGCTSFCCVFASSGETSLSFPPYARTVFSRILKSTVLFWKVARFLDTKTLDTPHALMPGLILLFHAL